MSQEIGQDLFIAQLQHSQLILINPTKRFGFFDTYGTIISMIIGYARGV